MATKVRVWLALLTLAAVLIVVALSGPTRAAAGKDLRPDVVKIGDMYKAGKGADAAKESVKVAKMFEETADVMHLFRARNKGGMGWGHKSITTNPAEDGLEKKLQALAKTPPANIAKEAPAAEEAAYDLAALADLIKAKAPTKSAGRKTPKAWNEFSDQMREASLELAKAAAGKNAATISKAAAKVNSSCNACHSIFKE